MPEISKEELEAIKPLLHPIIYVRGYAMTESERDETTADPFCGFNLGSTVYRAAIQKENRARKFIFESPVVRLMSDFGYSDIYENGRDIADDEWSDAIPYRSIIIYRYYESGSNLLGDGKSSPIEKYAEGLGKLIAKVQDLATIGKTGAFKCYLVAHSMGGLVCRAFLQNPKFGSPALTALVDKVYTYATPHNGIEMAGVNIPAWLSVNDMSNFSRKEMAEYLALTSDAEYQAQKDTEGRVDYLRNFSPDRFFCMVGTNRADYNVAVGLSRAFAGHGSDGLVKVDNAALWGKDATGATIPCPRAYAYRSHSGYFGIVNSEEAFQNLTRFLFGDLRVDIWFDVKSVTLPLKLQKDAAKVEAAYHFEILAAPKGKPWYLTRRISEEDSVTVRTHAELSAPGKSAVYLSTVFLSNWAKVDRDEVDKSLSYAVTFRVGVQEYLVKGLIFGSHYEGMKFFADTLLVRITPDVEVGWAWAQDTKNKTRMLTESEKQAFSAGKPISVSVPVKVAAKDNVGGIDGELRFVATPWNVGPA